MYLSVLNIPFYNLRAGAVGIEPTSMVLETTVLPLNYAPMYRRSKTAEDYYSIRHN